MGTQCVCLSLCYGNCQNSGLHVGLGVYHLVTCFSLISRLSWAVLSIADISMSELFK